MNLGGGGGKGLQFCGHDRTLGGGGDGGGGGGDDGGGGGGGEGGGSGGGDGDGGGGLCSPQVYPQGHDPHLISVSGGWSNFLEDVRASTRDENEMHKRNSIIIVCFCSLQFCVGDTIVREKERQRECEEGCRGYTDVLALSLVHEWCDKTKVIH